MKMSLWKTALLVLALVLGFVLPDVRAQQPPAKSEPAPQQPNAPQATPATPATPELAAPKLNPEEETGYKAFLEVKPDNPQALISSGEEFLKKFPQSPYAESVYARLAAAYQRTGQEAKMFAAGEKALELNPDDVDTLSLMAAMMPRRLNSNDLDFEQKLQKTQHYATHAIELLTRIQKPSNMTDEQFAQAKTTELSACHSGLGLVYFYEKKYPEMVTEMEQATKIVSSPDPVDQFLLGVAYEQTKRFADAATVFQQCSQSAGPMQDRCKAKMEEAKKLAATQPATPKP